MMSMEESGWKRPYLAGGAGPTWRTTDDDDDDVRGQEFYLYDTHPNTPFLPSAPGRPGDFGRREKRRTNTRRGNLQHRSLVCAPRGGKGKQKHLLSSACSHSGLLGVPHLSGPRGFSGRGFRLRTMMAFLGFTHTATRWAGRHGYGYGYDTPPILAHDFREKGAAARCRGMTGRKGRGGPPVVVVSVLVFPMHVWAALSVMTPL